MASKYGLVSKPHLLLSTMLVMQDKFSLVPNLWDYILYKIISLKCSFYVFFLTLEFHKAVPVHISDAHPIHIHLVCTNHVLSTHNLLTNLNPI